MSSHGPSDSAGVTAASPSAPAAPPPAPSSSRLRVRPPALSRTICATVLLLLGVLGLRVVLLELLGRDEPPAEHDQRRGDKGERQAER